MLHAYDPFTLSTSALETTAQVLTAKTPGFDGVDPGLVLAAVLNATANSTSEPERVYEVIPKRQPPAGHSSVGVSVLTAGGHLGSREEKPLPLRLDSGANITLIAKTYLESMLSPPKIRKGLKVQIAQLTNDNPKIEGYVDMPVWIRAVDGTWLKFRAEMYVVPDMTVDCLLGEDWHVNNELCVMRSVADGSRVVVGKTGFAFDARKQHKRDRANRQRRKRVYADGAVLAWEDVTIPAESWKDVVVTGDFQQGREWYVERALVPLPDGQFLTVPNTFLSTTTSDAGCAEPMSIARRNTLPISNPTCIPRVIRAGTLLGYAKDPAKYLDKPRNEEELEKFQQAAEVLRVLIASMQESPAAPPAPADTEQRHSE
ncbi:hypothetical protein EXIGLDRAFT_613669, partial [Exidia glandulosa HHB12029]